ncbi:hypothetical protein G9A89_009679 [Geosiphon pyriformis]|nr:hypothetical protein G9A89_009679 [Geosiphon pyriformis]
MVQGISLFVVMSTSWKFRLIVSALILIFLSLFFIPPARAWDQEDYEIFDLVDELENAEGSHETFYSWIGLEESATEKEIGKAYRKKSLTLHPDKNPDERTQEKFARLGKITAILRSPESRKRYNFFLKNGVPRWRGTGYYYRRHRPGVLNVLAFLLILASLLHYLVMWINFYQERKRIRFYIQEARELAWGKRMKKQDTRKRINVNELQFIVEGEYVAFITDDGDEFPLDEEEIMAPRVLNSFMFAAPKWAYNFVLEKFTREKEASHLGNGVKDSKNKVEHGSADDKSSFSSDDEQSMQSEAGGNVTPRQRRARNKDRRGNKNRR